MKGIEKVLNLRLDRAVWTVAYAIKKKPNTANIAGIHRMLCKFIVVPPGELTLWERSGAHL
jgi:hypothetical protein